MTDCMHLSDRMPEVAAGRATWGRSDAEHLLACASCAAEWRLVQSASRLGLAVKQQVDPARVAHAVVTRLRQEPVERPVRRGAWVRRVALPVAAAAVLAVAVWVGRPSAGEGPAAVTLAAVLPELDDLDAAELESLVSDFDVTGDPTVRALEAPESLDDLSDAELESLLRLMEG